MSKLRYYGIRGTPYKLIKSYLTYRKQCTYINVAESTTFRSTHGVPQGSVLGPLLFLIYINDLNKVIQHSSMHHFADDTNLLYSSNSLKQISKYVNHGLKLIAHLLRVNRISLNVDKTEIVIFRPKRKEITKNMKFRISGQKIIPKTPDTVRIYKHSEVEQMVFFQNLNTVLNTVLVLIGPSKFINGYLFFPNNLKDIKDHK